MEAKRKRKNGVKPTGPPPGKVVNKFKNVPNRFIQKKNAKASAKRKVEDLSESDFDSDDDLGMNGPEYGLLSDTASSDGEPGEGIPELAEVPAFPKEGSDDSEEDEDDDEADEEDDVDKDSDNEEDSDAESTSSVEVPEPKGLVEGDESEEEPEEKLKNPKRDMERESRTIFVGNLPCDIKKMKLKKWFSKFGEVETVRLRCPPVADPNVPKKVSVVQKDFHADRTNINAFVRFVDVASSEKALQANGHQWDDTHHIRVDMAVSLKRHDDKKAVFIGNLPFDAEEEQLRDIFVDCGDVTSVRIIRDRRTNVGKGFAFVNFATRHSVQTALSKNGEKVGNRSIRVKKCDYQGPSSNPSDRRRSRNVSQTFVDKRNAFIQKKFKGKKEKKTDDSRPSFQGEQAKKREKRMKKKKDKKKNQKANFIEALNSKPKKNRVVDVN